MRSTETLFSELISGQDARAEQAALALGRTGADALPGLSALLADDDPDHRWWAVRTLGEIDDPAGNPLLKKALHDPASTVRQCAARALINHPADTLIPDLIGCLGSEDPLLARLAGSALAAAGRPAVPSLLATMETGTQRARLEAVKALAGIKDPRAIPAFFHAVQDGDSPLVEYWAEIGLENLGIGMAFFHPG